MRWLIAFSYVFISFRVIHNADYGMENGAFVIQITEKQAPVISPIGLKFFDFEI